MTGSSFHHRGCTMVVLFVPGICTKSLYRMRNIREFGLHYHRVLEIYISATLGPPRALEQQQRWHKQQPPPSKACCPSLLPGRGCAFVNERNLNAQSLSLHRTPVSSTFGPSIIYLFCVFSCYGIGLFLSATYISIQGLKSL